MAGYPAHLMRRRRLPDGRTVTVRPVRETDEAALLAFLSRLSERTHRLRFQRAADTPDGEHARLFTHIDYGRHMAFVCEAPDGSLVGDARYLAHDDGRGAEFGIVVADDWHHSGIAQLLMDALIRAAQARGLDTLEGTVLRDNQDMLDFMRELGFDAVQAPEDPGALRVLRKL